MKSSLHATSLLARLCRGSCGCLRTVVPGSGGVLEPSGSSTNEWVPPPDASIPRGPYKLARKINKNEVRLVHDIKRWRRNGALRGAGLVPEIKLRALFQQRVTRVLIKQGRLYNKVLWRLKPVAKWFFKANVRGGPDARRISVGRRRTNRRRCVTRSRSLRTT